MRLYLLVPLFIILFITSCSDNNDSQNEDITKEIINTELLPIEPIKEEDHNLIAKPVIKEVKKDFILFDSTNNIKQSIKIRNNKIDFKNMDKPIVILNFFSSWCLPCIGQTPYLSDLQNKYKKNISIMGLVVNEDISNNEIKEFKKKNNVKFFLSNDQENNNQIISILKKNLNIDKLTLPLAVIYNNDEYYMHYEGAVPIEMMESDILQILESKKN